MNKPLKLKELAAAIYEPGVACEEATVKSVNILVDFGGWTRRIQWLAREENWKITDVAKHGKCLTEEQGKKK